MYYLDGVLDRWLLASPNGAILRNMSNRASPPAAENATEPGAARISRAGVILLALGVASLAGAGLMMWAVQGPAVFNEVVLAALAWCF
ncbi:hypothetical protein [Salinarimonas ramus]|uniref:Uncharacterized protein n=1 Tax=Salinarimonas ramus TaxID=690164 RepID=A0A917Q7T3_9HYPH|nr:hypothetical protein [Salinarimonas ramus]GGK29024.1 hypothetical protein GCM10011322_14310 [Salinarimonas ramus]